MKSLAVCGVLVAAGAIGLWWWAPAPVATPPQPAARPVPSPEAPSATPRELAPRAAAPQAFPRSPDAGAASEAGTSPAIGTEELLAAGNAGVAKGELELAIRRAGSDPEGVSVLARAHSVALAEQTARLIDAGYLAPGP